MALTIDTSALFKAQYKHLKAQVAKLDLELKLRYGDRYDKIKQQFGRAKDWYQTTKSDAQNSNTIPLEQKQDATNRRFAKAGSTAAIKEGIIKQKLKTFWHSITKD
jgi:hypothetical protein